VTGGPILPEMKGLRQREEVTSVDLIPHLSDKSHLGTATGADTQSVMKDDNLGRCEAGAPIHVLHVITSLHIGGAERMLVKIVSGLDERFHCTVVCLTDEGPLATDLRRAGSDVVALGMRGGRDLPFAVWRLRGLIRRLRPDVIQTWLYHADLVGTLAHRLAGVKASLIWNIRCSNMDLGQYNYSTSMILRVLTVLSRGIDRVIVNSESGRALHQTLGYRPRKWMLVPNGFDTARFRPDLEARTEVRKELGIADEAPLIGSISRFDPMKDHANLLNAFALLAEERPDARILLAGRGVDHDNPQLTEHPTLAKHGDRIHLLGERRDVPRLMAALDVFILSSAFGEGFPNVVGEAMACGIRCVVTDVGDAAAVVGDTGTIVPRCDSAALSDALRGMLDEPATSRAHREQMARRRVVDLYSIDRIVSIYTDVYCTGDATMAKV